MRTRLFIIIFFIAIILQTGSSQQGSQPLRVVGAAGTVLEAVNGYTLGFTVGEVAIWTLGANDVQLRQGFWQGYEVLVPVIEAGGARAEITVFPNPYDGALYVETKGNLTQPFDMLLFDPDGRLLLTQRVHPPGTTLFESARSLPPGAYVLSIRSEKGEVLGSAKVVKVR